MREVNGYPSAQSCSIPQEEHISRTATFRSLLGSLFFGIPTVHGNAGDIQSAARTPLEPSPSCVVFLQPIHMLCPWPLAFALSVWHPQTKSTIQWCTFIFYRSHRRHRGFKVQFSRSSDTETIVKTSSVCQCCFFLAQWKGRSLIVALCVFKDWVKVILAYMACWGNALQMWRTVEFAFSCG